MSVPPRVVSPSLLAVVAEEEEDPPDADSDVAEENDDDDDDDDEIGSVEAEMETLTEHGDGPDEIDETDETLFKFIDRSVQYQDLLLAKKHATERLEHFKGFALQMSPQKQPDRVLANCAARVERANSRIETYRNKYAVGRKRTLEKRAKVVDERASLTEEQRNVDRVARSAIRKQNKYWRSVATRAALAAVAELGENASEKEKMAVSVEAFQKAFADATTASTTPATSTTSITA